MFLALVPCRCWTPVAASRERDVTTLENLRGGARRFPRFSVSVGGACMNINEFPGHSHGAENFSSHFLYLSRFETHLAGLMEYLKKKKVILQQDSQVSRHTLYLSC